VHHLEKGKIRLPQLIDCLCRLGELLMGRRNSDELSADDVAALEMVEMVHDVTKM
jgi:hypothetical protein